MFGPFKMFAVALLLVVASAPYAKHYVETRKCGKHLAVISQAARVWANAHNGRLPSGFIIMPNELVTPRLLICPGDKSREPADNWQAFTSANSSYQVLEGASGAKDLPLEILQNMCYMQCKVHGGNYANALGKVFVYSRPIPITILFLKGLVEMRRLSQTPISADEVLLEFTGRPVPDLEVTRAVMLRNMNGEWRLVLFNQLDADGKITEVAPWVSLARS